ncbi:GntR family transcriptional regulator [Castellaniella sp.]|uniref:GntR family transcriptional regulator n=1 Tax=Castellaniella sp. TaxID=1955812 RepID=UPI003C73E27D
MSQAKAQAIPGTRTKNQKELDSDQIYERIQTAILERRLLPGTKLAEEHLAKATGANRMRIRRVLARLAHEQIVTLVPNRGAYVARPTTEEAREMFEARRMIEPPLVAKLCQSVRPEDLTALREHLDKEVLAHHNNDLRAIIRLSGEFHILLAQMARNGPLVRMIRELTSLTCLIITLYDRPGTPACPEDEHAQLVRLIEKGDGAAASLVMLQHLDHIERTLNLDGDLNYSPDFDAIFSG